MCIYYIYPLPWETTQQEIQLFATNEFILGNEPGHLTGFLPITDPKKMHLF